MTTIFTEEFCNLYSLTIDCGKGARLYSRWIQRNHPYPKESPISVAPLLEMSVWVPSRIVITQLNSTLTGLSFIKAIFAVFSPPKKHQQENDLQRALANLGGTVSHTNTKHCNITVQLAWENSPHLATLPLFARQMTSGKREQKFHTDEVSLPRSGWCFWLVVPGGKFDSANKRHYPNLCSDASSVWKFYARLSDVIWRGNQR